eukprot:gene3063-13082_t
MVRGRERVSQGVSVSVGSGKGLEVGVVLRGFDPILVDEINYCHDDPEQSAHPSLGLLSPTSLPQSASVGAEAGLLAWLSARGGIVSPKLNLFHRLESGGSGVMALSDIAPGEQLVIVPSQSTLHVCSAEELAK